MSASNEYCEASDIRMISHAIESTASLYLLKAVEGTVDALVKTQRMLEDAYTSCSKHLEIFTNSECTQAVDPEEVAINLLEDSQNILRKFHENMTMRLELAQADGQLQGAHEESVVSEYAKTIELIDYLYDAITELRLAVMEHDANLEEATDETFDSADAVMASIQ